MNIERLAYLFATLIFSITIFAQAVSANQTDEVRFSLTVWDQTLESVLSDIEQITGFTIIVESKIKSAPISGAYNNVTVRDFISMAVKEKNITVSVDSEQNVITISKTLSSKNNLEDFIASEIEYITQAQHSINKPSNNQMRDLETDLLTVKIWSEVAQQVRPSVHERKKSQLSQADFLASESDYATKVKKTTKSAHKRDKSEGNIDPISGKNWKEIEAEIQ